MSDQIYIPEINAFILGEYRHDVRPGEKEPASGEVVPHKFIVHGFERFVPKYNEVIGEYYVKEYIDIGTIHQYFKHAADFANTQRHLEYSNLPF